MIAKPGLAENTSVLGLGDGLAVCVQLDFIAHTTRERAGGALDYCQTHFFFPLPSFSPSARDGRTNVQPSSRPRKLPRIRLGIYRPVSINSHAGTDSSSPGRQESAPAFLLSIIGR